MIEMPTPYPDVNAVLETLLGRVRAILGDQLVGMYLDGSLANGDFDQASDIDFIAVTSAPVSADQFAALRAMHAQLAAGDPRWGSEIEGSYIAQAALRRYDPSQALHPNIERGRAERLKMQQHDRAWLIHCWILRERGITLAGPAPHTLIDPIAPADLRLALREVLPGWAAHMLQNPAKLARRGYQSYTVLTFCRVLYTLDTGMVASKPAAASWAQASLGARWAPLIARALAGRHHPDAAAQAADVAETLALIRLTLERSLL